MWQSSIRNSYRLRGLGFDEYELFNTLEQAVARVVDAVGGTTALARKCFSGAAENRLCELVGALVAFLRRTTGQSFQARADAYAQGNGKSLNVEAISRRGAHSAVALAQLWSD